MYKRSYSVYTQDLLDAYRVSPNTSHDSNTLQVLKTETLPCGMTMEHTITVVWGKLFFFNNMLNQ